MRQIEFLLAWENGTWTIAVFPVPADVPYEGLVKWAYKNLLTQAQFRRAVLAAVYNEQPDTRDDEQYEDATVEPPKGGRTR